MLLIEGFSLSGGSSLTAASWSLACTITQRLNSITILFINVQHPENFRQFPLKKVRRVFIALLISPQWLQFRYYEQTLSKNKALLKFHLTSASNLALRNLNLGLRWSLQKFGNPSGGKSMMISELIPAISPIDFFSFYQLNCLFPITHFQVMNWNTPDLLSSNWHLFLEHLNQKLFD